MRYEELKDAIEGAQRYVSGTAETVLGYVLDRFSEYEDTEDEIDEYEVWDAISEEIDSYFTYYSDAWDYLQDNSITDFEEAIHYGDCTNICSIAYYYCEDEIRNELSF